MSVDISDSASENEVCNSKVINIISSDDSTISGHQHSNHERENLQNEQLCFEQQQQQDSHLPLSYQSYMSQHEEEKNHWDDVCRAYRQYATFALCQWKNQRSRLDSLPESQRRLLPSGLKRGTPESQKRQITYKQAAIRNQYCLDSILNHAGMPNSQQVPSTTQIASDGHISKVSSVLKSLARDWSAEGKPERDMAYQPILKSVKKYLPTTGPAGTPPNLCVPGAGVGRLALELFGSGYSVQGNEFSLFMLLASDFILNSGVCPDRPLQISPWMLETRNCHSSKDPFRAITIPDVDPCSVMVPEQEGPDFSMAAGDFHSIYSNPNQYQQFDGVVSCFFLDAAPGIVEYLQTIYNMLRPGGVLFNLGPLLHHWSGPAMRPDDTSFEDYKKRYHFLDKRYMTSIDLSWEDIREILVNIGFFIEDEEIGVPALYTADRKSMMNLSYRCVRFVARKAQ